MRLEKYIVEAKGDTSATTIIHEVGTGLFSFKPSAQVTSKDEFIENVLKYNIVAINASGGELPIEPYLQKLPETFAKKQLEVLADARKIGQKISKVFGTPSKVKWAGPTNDQSDYGAADIVVVDKSRKEIPISLKFGAGQLKNMGLGNFVETIFASYFGSEAKLSDVMFSSKYIPKWDLMTQRWLEIVNNMGFEGLDDYRGMGWNKYQKEKIDAEEQDELSQNLKKSPASDFLRKWLKTFYSDAYPPMQGNPEWIQVRDKTTEEVFLSMLRDKEKVVLSNMRKLFKFQLSAGKQPLWLVAKGGKDIMYIPSAIAVDKWIKKLLTISYSTSVASEGFVFTLHIKQGEKKIVDIHIAVRWKQGQMDGKPATASSKTMYMSAKDWNTMFNQGNIWEGVEITGAVNEWVGNDITRTINQWRLL